MARAQGPARLPLLPAVTTAILVAAIGGAGVVHLRDQQRQYRGVVEAQLAAIAELKVSQITSWREERLGDATFMTANRALARDLKRVLLEPGRPFSAESQAWLEAIARHGSYGNASIVDARGRILATAGSGFTEDPADLEEHVAEALRRRGPFLTELERHRGAGAHLDLVAPLLDPERPDVGLGAVVLRLDPSRFLFPALQRWPTPSASAESLLVRAEGDALLYLNELRHRSGTPLSVRLPISSPVPAARFLRGEQGVLAGPDYRGIAVVAAGARVPDTGWILVAKVDAEEILAPGRAESWMLGAIFVLLMAGAAGVTALWRRTHGARLERARFEAEREREARSRHLEILSEHAADAVLLIDDRGFVVAANDRVLDTYGRTAAELVGTDVRALRAPGADEHRFEELVERGLREGRVRYETLGLRKDGGTVPVEVTACPFQAQGRWFFQAIVRDVTERKEALRALQLQGEIVRNLYDAVIALDPDHVIRSWNPAAERIYGWSEAQVLGRPVSEVLPSEYDGYTYSEFKEALHRSGRLVFEVRRRRRDGSCVDVEGSAVVLRDDAGRTTGYVSVNRDVTARKRAEAALRASQERLARLLDVAREGIWIVDADGRTEFVNARAAAIIGRPAEEIVGRGVLEVVPELVREHAREDLAALARGESPGREFCEHRQGEEIWTTLSWTGLRDDAGRVSGGLCLLMDVTEHRRAREQLLQAQKMEAVGQLASGIAHDFNNLLVGILTSAGFLLDSLPEGDERREDAKEIKDAGERAARLVRQLLLFGRKSRLHPVALDVNSAVRAVEGLLRRTLGEHVAMSLSLEPEPWAIRIDPGQLEQVIMNLAVNARDAMPRGGELVIATRNVAHATPLASEGLAPGRYVALRVSDTGCGMDPEILPKIFEPFFTTKETGRGTGLGLATVYGVVKSAGGTIEVESAVGRGTAFTIHLPAVAEAAGREPAEPGPRPLPRGHGETVLLVEDEDAVRRATRRILEEHGFRVIDTGSGAEVLRLVHGDVKVDVVLSDVVMPQMSGPELAAAINDLRPGIPFVLMSGYSEWQPEGAGVIQKPFTAEALLARVHAALAGRSRAA